MTATSERAAGGASPVDFDTYGDYGSYKKKSQEEQPPDQFVRAPYPFRGRISADGSSEFPAQAGRYHLYISWACPWAQRTAIVRRLLGLEDVISMTVVDPIRDGRGWAFRHRARALTRRGQRILVLAGGLRGDRAWVSRAHLGAGAVGQAGGRIVSNNFPDITIDLDTAFGRWADPGVELYPAELRAEIDEINELVYSSGEQRGVPVRVRAFAAGLPRGGDRPVQHA